jgi:hypothetical protein
VADQDPYLVPGASVALAAPPAAVYRWRRVFAWLLVIHLIPNVLGFASGLALAGWELFGDTIEVAAHNLRETRFWAIGAASYLLYLSYLEDIRWRRAIHLTLLFALVELVGTAEDYLIWQTPAHELVYWPTTVRHVASAALALVTSALLWPMKSNSLSAPTPTPTPLRDAV